MLKVTRIGGSFSHAHCSTLWKIPNNLEYIADSDIVISIDESIGFFAENKKNFGWLHESKSIQPEIYAKVKTQKEYLKTIYSNIFTHDRDLLKLDENFFKFSPACGYWIEYPKLYPKSKNVSFITSNKTQCPGHRYRLFWLDKLRGKVDVFGRGINEIVKKEEGLCDYYFSIVIENGKYDTYFTEKILDCFATGTIPIYYGTDNIIDYFNSDGIIFLTEDFDFSILTEENYKLRLDAVLENLELVKKYNTVEDWFVDHGQLI